VQAELQAQTALQVDDQAAPVPPCIERATNTSPAAVAGRHSSPLADHHQAARKRTMTRPYAWSSVVVGTGVDPVTFRFSGGRSAD
jgi:hypothetical protein